MQRCKKVCSSGGVWGSVALLAFRDRLRRVATSIRLINLSWLTWEESNSRIFDKKASPPTTICDNIICELNVLTGLGYLVCNGSNHLEDCQTCTPSAFWSSGGKFNMCNTNRLLWRVFNEQAQGDVHSIQSSAFLLPPVSRIQQFSWMEQPS